MEILVFSDANQTTPAHWLQALVQPLVQGEAVVSSSFHHIIPQDNRLATLGRSFAVFMIYLGKGISSLGSTLGRVHGHQAGGLSRVGGGPPLVPDRGGRCDPGQKAPAGQDQDGGGDGGGAGHPGQRNHGQLGGLVYLASCCI